MGWIQGHVGFIEACNFPVAPLMACEYTTHEHGKPWTALQWADRSAWRDDNASSQVSCTLIKEGRRARTQDGFGSKSHNWQMTYELCQVTMPHQACQKTFLIKLLSQNSSRVSFVKITNSKFNRPFALGNLWNLVRHFKSNFFNAHMHTMIATLKKCHDIKDTWIELHPGYNVMEGREVSWSWGKYYGLGMRRPLVQFWFPL